ncbi:MAG: hypothetical protein ACYTFY_09530 [Planctomycetota bacterium]|jgi:hypothetical protein
MLARKYEGKAFFTISETQPSEYHHILNLQKFANSDTEKLEVECGQESAEGWITYKATSRKLIVASVMAKMEGNTCVMRKLAIHPFYTDKKPANLLFDHIESKFYSAEKYAGRTSTTSTDNVSAYRDFGFAEAGTEEGEVNSYVYFEKINKRL